MQNCLPQHLPDKCQFLSPLHTPGEIPAKAAGIPMKMTFSALLLEEGTPESNRQRTYRAKECLVPVMNLFSDKVGSSIHHMTPWDFLTSFLAKGLQRVDEEGRVISLGCSVPALGIIPFPQPSFSTAFPTRHILVLHKLDICKMYKARTLRETINGHRDSNHRGSGFVWGFFKLTHFVATFSCLPHFTDYPWNATCQMTAESSGNTFHPSISWYPPNKVTFLKTK